MSGLPTNVRFLKRLAGHPSFAAAELDTSFIAKHQDSLIEAVAPPVKAVAMAALARHLLEVQVVPFLAHCPVAFLPPCTAKQSTVYVPVHDWLCAGCPTQRAKVSGLRRQVLALLSVVPISFLGCIELIIELLEVCRLLREKQVAVMGASWGHGLCLTASG